MSDKLFKITDKEHGQIEGMVCYEFTDSNGVRRKAEEIIYLREVESDTLLAENERLRKALEKIKDILVYIQFHDLVSEQTEKAIEIASDALGGGE